ncbi:hypothetical protein [Carbonactinospora thermoautotrophica]|nr:hypothetical protein [Carbonactinospora thermoautotrophica]
MTAAVTGSAVTGSWRAGCGGVTRPVEGGRVGGVTHPVQDGRVGRGMGDGVSTASVFADGSAAVPIGTPGAVRTLADGAGWAAATPNTSTASVNPMLSAGSTQR